MSTRSRRICSLLALALAAGAHLGCDGSTESDGDGDVDGDIDADADSDGDSDADGDGDPSSPVVDTGQSRCWDTAGSEIDCSDPDEEDLYGQDALYDGRQASYTENGDGTVTDDVTGLMWTQEPEVSTYADAESTCAALTTGDHDDWRVPSIRELYSLIDFDGSTGTAAPESTAVPDDAVPYIDTAYFNFYYGNEVELGAGGRFIDSQYITTSVYVSTVMDGQTCFFGGNFADGRIKCYPTDGRGRSYFLQCVRGAAYGESDLEDNGDGTITDGTTGLTWLQQDSGHFEAGDLGDGTLDWPGALSFCESLDYAGSTDWRLPDAKELQSLVDYTRSPGTTSSPAIDPLFETTSITNEMDQADYPFFWSSTTHLDGVPAGAAAIYVAFGRATGYMDGQYMDVHGAGAQRSDPKVGDRGDATCNEDAPQGDCQRIYNFARCVRD